MFAALTTPAATAADLVTAGAAYTTTVLAQGPTPNTGPRGEEFGKASPIGLFVILGLLFVVIVIGFGMNRRLRRMERRQAFADKHGIDVFDEEKLEKAMKDSGYEEMTKGGVMYARTEVPQTDSRFEPASSIGAQPTGPEAFEAERRQAEGAAEGIDGATGSGKAAGGKDEDDDENPAR